MAKSHCLDVLDVEWYLHLVASLQSPPSSHYGEINRLRRKGEALAAEMLEVSHGLLAAFLHPCWRFSGLRIVLFIKRKSGFYIINVHNH